MSKRRCIIVGAGGHARVLIKALRRLDFDIVALVDADPKLKGASVLNAPVLGGEEALAGQDRVVLLVNGIGSTGDMTLRREVHRRMSAQGFRFATVLHPAAFCEDDAMLGPGAQIMAGAVVQTGCRIGADTIVNTSASVDHDCIIGAHCHIGPGAVLSGGVEIGEATHVGTGAVIIQGVRIGANCLIAAGSVVVGPVLDHARVGGTPARSL
jgi:sugar O-acyltransferase (sialic acid O-acetyltransferase NeuD family)